jgi:glycerol-3-phosphate acyltransferase PlsX
MITVALDAMGADGGPEPVVQGALQLTAEEAPIRIVLVGDREPIEQLLQSERYDQHRLRVVHASGAVQMTDKPAAALDRDPNCSVLCAARLVQQGEADALVSAGNTGAVILAAARTFERLPGIRRVGLAAVYPTAEKHGPHQDPFALMLDVGATLNCSADDLVAFAVMGSAYSRIISSIERPRVGLLSNGAEPTKGTPAIVEAHARLAELESVEFVGNVEGVDIPRGTVDVIVCEGFVGNIVLKMLEGVSEVAKDLARAALHRKLWWKMGMGLLSTGIQRVRTLTDWQQYGGAPIVGFDHLVIKAHGRSNARAIRNALKVAAKAVDNDIAHQIRSGL